MWRVYCQLRLNRPRRRKRRLPRIPWQPLTAPREANQVWALDFMHDRLYSGRTFRTSNVIDESNRQALAIEIDTSLPSGWVIRVMEQLRELRGLPQAIRLDNGSETAGASLRRLVPGPRDHPSSSSSRPPPDIQRLSQ